MAAYIESDYTLSAHELEALCRLAQALGLDATDPDGQAILSMAKVRIERLTSYLRRVRTLHSPVKTPSGQVWLDGSEKPKCVGCSTVDPFLESDWPCLTRLLADGEDLT